MWRLESRGGGGGMTHTEVLLAVYKMADDEVQQPGDNEHRYRSLIRIRDYIKKHIDGVPQK